MEYCEFELDVSAGRADLVIHHLRIAEALMQDCGQGEADYVALAQVVARELGEHPGTFGRSPAQAFASMALADALTWQQLSKLKEGWADRIVDAGEVTPDGASGATTVAAEQEIGALLDRAEWGRDEIEHQLGDLVNMAMERAASRG